MKSSEAFRIIKRAGWYVISQRGSHIKLAHVEYSHTIVFPYHGSKEIAKGLQKKLFKEARIDV
jgi:predicted RNA binding protein YcfA (HicA-like mRNA interferase family)